MINQDVINQDGIFAAFQRLRGRAPTDEELKRVHQIAAAIGVTDNDVFLLLIFALDHYFGLFQEIPGKIVAAQKAASQAAVKEIESSTQAVIDKTKAEIEFLGTRTQRDLSKAVYEASEETAKAANFKTMVKYISLAVIVSVISFCLLCSVFSLYFVNVGVEKGLVLNRDEELRLKERDAFTKTPAFELAKSYYDAGLLEKILSCKNQGWKIEKGECIPYPEKTTKGHIAYGWKMPELPK